MAINVGSNFAMQAALPLDSRVTVADFTERDAIDAGVRYDGMKVYVVSSGTNFQLVGGITNSDWYPILGDIISGIFYLRGTESSDGSWRFNYDLGGMNLEERIAGVWTIKNRWN